MRFNLIWMQSLTSHMYALVTVNHIRCWPWFYSFEISHLLYVQEFALPFFISSSLWVVLPYLLFRIINLL